MIARKLEMKKKAARGAALFVHDKQRIGMGKSMRGRTQPVFFARSETLYKKLRRDCQMTYRSAHSRPVVIKQRNQRLGRRFN
jgi:hypothetical protein